MRVHGLNSLSHSPSPTLGKQHLPNVSANNPGKKINFVKNAASVQVGGASPVLRAHLWLVGQATACAALLGLRGRAGCSVCQRQSKQAEQNPSHGAHTRAHSSPPKQRPSRAPPHLIMQ